MSKNRRGKKAAGRGTSHKHAGVPTPMKNLHGPHRRRRDDDVNDVGRNSRHRVMMAMFHFSGPDDKTFDPFYVGAMPYDDLENDCGA